MQRLLLLVLLALPALASAGTIYKCAGPTGATVFSQVPCGTDAAAIGPGGRKLPAGGTADAAGGKTTRADIDNRCDAESHHIIDGYAARFADANASIADLHKHLLAPGSGQKDAGLQKQIDALEAQKTDLLGAQDRELATLRDQCQAERTAEQKRESERAVVKR